MTGLRISPSQGRPRKIEAGWVGLKTSEVRFKQPGGRRAWEIGSVDNGWRLHLKVWIFINIYYKWGGASLISSIERR